ncbi:MAG TPA: HAD-IB family phosphatase [Candidatus Saccharimonadales bacterium]|nr:HAD-IB family phosphatase [Candidatus Saccharimonadales bacterium]
MKRFNPGIRLVVFDLDGTLTPVDSLWTYLHAAFGTGDKGKESARMYRDGQLTYAEWASADARCWAGISLRTLENALDKIPFRSGAKELFQTLKARGVKTAIVSAGLSILANKAKNQLGADFAMANDLILRDGVLTGEIIVNVNLSEKMEFVKRVAAQLHIECDEVALVGDRPQDLTIPDCLKIAINPQDQLTIQSADCVIGNDCLLEILEILK